MGSIVVVVVASSSRSRHDCYDVASGTSHLDSFRPRALAVGMKILSALCAQSLLEKLGSLEPLSGHLCPSSVSTLVTSTWLLGCLRPMSDREIESARGQAPEALWISR